MSKSSALLAGHKIKIPYYHNRRSTRKLAEKHVVKQGENLNRIAKRYKVKTARLKKLNGLRSNIIHPGQILKLVSNTSTKYSSSQGGGGHRLRKKRIPSRQIHIVEIGDTLIGIAKKYNVSLPDLMQLNALNFKSVIQVGKRIIIPK